MTTLLFPKEGEIVPIQTAIQKDFTRKSCDLGANAIDWLHLTKAGCPSRIFLPED